MADGTQRSGLAVQLLCYLAVGGSACVADLLSFAALLRAGLDVLLASAIGFVVGTLVNHRLSVRWAFVGGRHRPSHELARLFAVALVGLALTTVVLQALLAAGLSPLPAKLLAIAVVFAWNFLGRRLFVFRAALPPRTAPWAAAADAAWLRLKRRRAG